MEQPDNENKKIYIFPQFKKKEELLSHRKTWRGLKGILLSERSQSKKAMYDQKGKRHEYPNVHRSTVYNSQDMEAT